MSLLSQEGTQQGDPLGMLLFSLVAQPIVLNIQAQFRPILRRRSPPIDGKVALSVCRCVGNFQNKIISFFLSFNVWMADDENFVAPIEDILRIYEYIKNEWPAYGLHIQESKTKVAGQK